jgi:APA family basic amino acid/polyamine antiporter
VTALVVSSALLTVLVFMNYSSSGTIVDLFTDIVLLATLTTLVPYSWSAAAQVKLFITDRELFSGVRLARDTVVATLAFAYTAWAIWGAGEEVIAKGFMLLTAGIPVYVWVKWMERREHRPVVPDYPPEQAAEPDEVSAPLVLY